jgi:thiol:disulfide interchange protein DsbC
MQVKLRTFVFGLLALIAFSSAHAESAESKKIRDIIKQQLKAEPTSIVKSPIEGLYEVTVPPRIFYVSADGRYVLLGNLIDINSRKNLTQEKEGLARVAALDKMGEASMIVFAPKQVKHTITVFTDIDCGYCRKLHNEIEQYNKLGIKVRYMAYPRAGIGSGSYKKAVSVWCAKDKNKAMTTAKNGGNVPSKECDNPVEQQFQLGQELGVNGTPALVLENGQIYPGYAPASKLIGVLESIKK